MIVCTADGRRICCGLDGGDPGLYRRHSRALVAAVLMLFATAQVSRGGTVLNIVQTGITGAQSQLDINHSYAWNFEVSGPLTFDSVIGKFTLKRGPSTSLDAVMTLWATDSSFTPLSQVGLSTLLPSSATQSFSLYSFFVSSTSTQLNGFYSLTLTSSAADVASDQWFIKGQTSSLDFLDGSGQAIPGITNAVGVVPEIDPAGMGSVLAFVGGALGLLERHRKRA